jgi:site-specific DNA-adenine methylase
MRLKPFFYFYGGKHRAAPRYPKPIYNTIIEPFAGSAGYSVRYYEKNIQLYDADPVICGVWDYLIKVKSEEILKLPLIVNHIDDHDLIQEAKWLVGFWLNKATTRPSKTPSLWIRNGVRPNSGWGQVIRERIASQVDYIRHWKIFNCSYENLENTEATWFIDPPYEKAGTFYKCQVDSYEELAEFCKSRMGQVMVCENEGASWLPFQPFAIIKSSTSKRGKGFTREAIWIK